MFDIGFWEIVVLGVVALIVVGPEQMPELIRTVLGYFRHFQRQLSSIKDDVERELDVEGFYNKEKGLHDLLNDDFNGLKDSIADIKSEYNSTLRDSDISEEIEHWDDPDYFEEQDGVESMLPDPELHSDTGLDNVPAELEPSEDASEEIDNPIKKND